MVIQGQSSTVPVTVADMAYHTRAVARGNQHALILADLPFMSYATIPDAIQSATTLMQAGAHVVKLEGGGWTAETVHFLTERGIHTRDDFIGLLQQVSKVYVATSGMGFEALLCGKSVRCFGLPWYAGWGVTEDEQRCARRIRDRSVRELFAAAYLRYTRYLNPVTHQQGSIFDVMAWLIRQRQMAGLA